MRLLMVWLLAILALAGTPALAEMPARPAGPVLDAANVIAPAVEATLDQRLRDYNRTTGRAVIVATVPSLDGLEVEDYAQKLGESWGIGGKETEEAVLLLVAPGERKLRIHAARGVQERVTDALAGRIIRDTMIPYLKSGDYGGGIAAGVDGIITQLDRSPADAKAVAEAAAAASKQSGNGNASAGSVIFWIVLILFFMMVFGRGNRRQGVRRSGIDPGIVLWGASEIARHMASGGRHGGGSDSGFGGFGGFGGGGGGFDGGGASGDW
jgi:uncharacterized protein